MSNPVIGIGTVARNKSDKNLCPHAAYNLMYLLTVIVKCNNICEYMCILLFFLVNLLVFGRTTWLAGS